MTTILGWSLLFSMFINLLFLVAHIDNRSAYKELLEKLTLALKARDTIKEQYESARENIRQELWL